MHGILEGSLPTALVIELFYRESQVFKGLEKDGSIQCKSLQKLHVQLFSSFEVFRYNF